MAASPGLEPRLTESESAVLPLDDEAIIQTTLNIYAFFFHLSNDLLRSGTKNPLLPNYIFRALIDIEEDFSFFKTKGYLL